MDKFYQACFNRLGGNDATSGWQLLNMSPGIPLQLKNLYEISQRSNQPAGNQVPKDLLGNDLCILEVLCDGSNVGISKVQYGLSDSFGRDNMFCHGYLFNNAYEMLKNPNSILRISDSNFRFTPEDTTEIPEALEMDEPWSEESALSLCGMDKQAYIDYISCLYYSLSSKAKTTIYIKTNGTTQMARALLYLAYSAVPYCMRTKISASTFGGTTAVTARLVFTDELPESCSYMDPATGDNNILTSNLKNRWKRYPFVDYYARHYEILVDKKEAYYSAIEAWLTRMGDPYMQDMDAIRLAFDMMRNKGDADIAGLLYDWLMLPVPNNETIERSLAELLRKAIEQNLDLGRDKEDLLFRRLEQTSSRELIRLGNQYQAKQLIKMSLDDAVNFMNSLTPESRVFNTMRENLASLDGGLEILREFYLRKANGYVSNKDLSYAELEEFSLTFSDLAHMEQVWKVIVERALQIAVDQIHKGASYKSAALKLRKFLLSTYKDVEWERFLYTMAEAYDHEFRSNFMPERADEYIEFYRDQYRGGSEQFAYSAELAKHYQAILNGNWMVAADFAANGCPLNGNPMRPIAEQAKAVRNLMVYALYCNAAQNCLEISFWCQMAHALGQNPVRLMIEKQVRVFCDQNELYRSIMDDPFWTDKNLEWISNQYRTYAERYSDNAYKKSFELLTREIKGRADEAKRIQKEQKRQERMDRQEKDGSFGKFLSRGVTNFAEDPQESEWSASGAIYPEDNRRGRRAHKSEAPSTREVVTNSKQEVMSPQKKESEQDGLLSGLSKFFGGIGGRGKK